MESLKLTNREFFDLLDFYAGEGSFDHESYDSLTEKGLIELEQHDPETLLFVVTPLGEKAIEENV